MHTLKLVTKMGESRDRHRFFTCDHIDVTIVPPGSASARKGEPVGVQLELTRRIVRKDGPGVVRTPMRLVTDLESPDAGQLGTITIIQIPRDGYAAYLMNAARETIQVYRYPPKSDHEVAAEAAARPNVEVEEVSQ